MAHDSSHFPPGASGPASQVAAGTVWASLGAIQAGLLGQGGNADGPAPLSRDGRGVAVVTIRVDAITQVGPSPAASDPRSTLVLNFTPDDLLQNLAGIAASAGVASFLAGQVRE